MGVILRSIFTNVTMPDNTVIKADIDELIKTVGEHEKNGALKNKFTPQKISDRIGMHVPPDLNLTELFTIWSLKSRRSRVLCSLEILIHGL